MDQPVTSHATVSDDPADRVVVGRGVAIDRLGLGLAPLGNMFRPMPDAEASDTLMAWWHRGLRTFDVAPVYGYGIAERRLGAFLAGRPRDRSIVSTKVGRLLREQPLRERALFDGDEPVFRDTPPGIEPMFDFSRDGIRRSIEESLERLDLDRVDILYLHDPIDHTDEAIGTGYQALEELRDEGIAGAIGVGVGDVRTMLRFARERRPDVLLLAGRYTLLDRTAGDELLPLCAERDIPVIACSVFNSGVIADPGADARYDYRRADDVVRARVREIHEVCRRHGVDVRTVAMRFPLRHPVVRAVVVGARSAEQANELVDLWSPVVPDAVWDELEALGPRT